MTNRNKYIVYLIIAIVFILLSIIIFFMAEGLRRWYSGGFFLIMGGIALLKAIYKSRNNE